MAGEAAGQQSAIQATQAGGGAGGDDDAALAAAPANGPGGGPAQKPVILAAAAFLGVATLLCLYFLFAFWPHPRPNLSIPAVQDTSAHARPDSSATASPATTSPAANAPQSTTSAANNLASRGGTDSTHNCPAGSRCAPGNVATLQALGYKDLAACIQKAAALSRDTVPDPMCVTVVRVGSAAWRVVIWDEQRILLLVLLAGALGSLLHAIRSLVQYVGNRKLTRSWLPQYYLQPFAGALMGLVMYVVLRGGFFSSSASVRDTSPFGFVGLAIVAGLFLGQAMEKLKSIADTVFAPVKAGDTLQGTPPAPGAGAPTPTPQPPPAAGAGSGTPTVTSVVGDAAGAAATALTISGTGFVSASRVRVNADERTPTSQTATTLQVQLTAADRQALDRGGELTITVVNPAEAGGASAPFQFQG